ncbi:MAG TPA: glutamate 5-kinase [Candidatus Acidoferrales bacterium]|nr:glutamate 5-kinase [Candidatus Acidoferrales bacterium]
MTNQNPETEQQRRLRASRRAVIKLGTGIVTSGEGQFNAKLLERVAQTIAHLKKDGRQIVLVSSGAVGLGRGRLGLHRDRLNDMVMRQACAAVGQSLLMHEYEKLFQSHGIHLAQVLLTEGDFVDRSRYSNLRQTMEALLKLGVLPIVNENDTVSTAELDYLNIRAGERIFSDNDRLAALVMSHIEADVLVLLTDVDGLMQLGPSALKSDAAQVVPLVEEITPELKSLAFGPSEGGRGGMLTKLEAAEIAMQAGGVAVIANGTKADTLDKIFDGTPTGTVFLSKTRMAGKRRWIAYAAGVRGRVIVNAGARAALTGGKASLLASGVTGVEGEFDAAEVVSIVDAEGVEFARGISDYSRSDAQGMIGNGSHRSAESAKSNKRATVLVKRDNIVLLDRK